MILPPWPTVESDRHLLSVSFEELSEDQALRKVRATVRDLLIGEIRRCIAGQIGMASLMLSMAAIDILGGLYCGVSAKQRSFVTFVSDFLPTYPPATLWKLRGAVLHNYQLLPGVIFALAPKWRDRHLSPVDDLGPGGVRLFIHGARLADDLDQAAEHLLLRARTEPELAVRVIRHARRHLLLMGFA